MVTPELYLAHISPRSRPDLTQISPRSPLYLAYIPPRSRLDLAYISHTSRLCMCKVATPEPHLAHISPISRLYLAYVSPISRLYRHKVATLERRSYGARGARGRGRLRRVQISLALALTTIYMAHVPYLPLYSMYLPHISPISHQVQIVLNPNGLAHVRVGAGTQSLP